MPSRVLFSGKLGGSGIRKSHVESNVRMLARLGLELGSTEEGKPTCTLNNISSKKSGTTYWLHPQLSFELLLHGGSYNCQALEGFGAQDIDW